MNELIVAFMFVCALCIYISVGIAYLIYDFLPWMYEDTEQTQLPPSVYQTLAVGVVWLWPKHAYEDLKWLLARRKANKETERRLQRKGL